MLSERLKRFLRPLLVDSAHVCRCESANDNVSVVSEYLAYLEEHDNRKTRNVTTMDPYSMTDKMDETILDAIVARLEDRGKHPLFRKTLDQYLDSMHIDKSDRVLDMGCGTGVAARAIARRPNFAGTVTGIDLSSYLASHAERFASEEGLSGQVEFRAGNTKNLDIRDAEYDAVVAHTLVSHVDDPVEVLKEAARVVKPGGMIGVFDGDYASITFGQENPQKAKEIDEAIIDAIVTSPRVMRQMPRLFQDVGLEIVASFPYILAEVGTMDYWGSAIESLRKLLPRSGAMTEAQASALADGLVEDSVKGVFFGASNFYTYIGRRV